MRTKRIGNFSAVNGTGTILGDEIQIGNIECVEDFEGQVSLLKLIAKECVKDDCQNADWNGIHALLKQVEEKIKNRTGG